MDTTEKIFPAAQKLMQSLIRKGVLVRLIGVYAGNLEAEAAGKQMLLLDQVPQKDRKLAAAMDDITHRFGEQAITRAALISAKKDASHKGP